MAVLLPRLNQLRRLSQVLHLITLPIRHATRQAVRGFGRGLYCSTQEPIPSLTWPSALACSFEVRLVRSLCVARPSCVSEALRLISCVRCRLLPRFDTDYFVSRTSGADLPEGVAQFCARGLEGCPAVGELPGGRSQIIACTVQVVLQSALAVSAAAVCIASPASHSNVWLLSTSNHVIRGQQSSKLSHAVFPRLPREYKILEGVDIILINDDPLGLHVSA